MKPTGVKKTMKRVVGSTDGKKRRDPATEMASSSRARSTGDGPSGKSSRYKAVVEKGKDDAAWKRDWSGFISNVKMKDNGQQVKLPKCMDYEESGESTFSYLFSSPAEKKAERKKKEIEMQKLAEKRKMERLKERKKRLREGGDAVDPVLGEIDEDDERSKMELALEAAKRRGMSLDGMNRKEKRQLLRLTVTEAQVEMETHQKEVKPHELMDAKLAWYQQGPYPLDVVSEKLVMKKAAKHARQQGLKYNYLTVHPSWIASRTLKRQQSKLVYMGEKVTFGEDGGVDKRDVGYIPMTSAMLSHIPPSSIPTAKPVFLSTSNLAHGKATDV